jgi:DNA invertase Pin-like site-specific DNA recombinase
MRIGYARQSTANQKNGLKNQIGELQKNNCEKIFSEEISSVATKRPELSKALEFCREGDTILSGKS